MVRCSILSGLVLTLAVNISLAQQQPPQGNRFGSVLNAMRGMRMPAAMLLATPEVQTELGVTEEQKTKMNEIRDDMQQDVRSAMSGIDFRAMGDMSEEDLQKKVTELRTKVEDLSKRIDAKIEKVLDEKQMKRLKQLQLQREGAAAFSVPEVEKKLALTTEQKAKIKKLQDDAIAQARTIFTPGASQEDRQAAMTKMRDSQAKVLKDIRALLTEDQLADWTEMTGKEFKFPQGGGFGGFGGGFGGGRGGRGGQQPNN
jgi:transcription termination factor NusB